MTILAHFLSAKPFFLPPPTQPEFLLFATPKGKIRNYSTALLHMRVNEVQKNIDKLQDEVLMSKSTSGILLAILGVQLTIL